MRIEHVGLFVRDINKTVEFYETLVASRILCK